VSLPLYTDHHISGAVIKELRRRGIDVLTAFEDEHAAASDEVLLVRATKLGRVIFTQDDDFLAIADDWQLAKRHFSGVIYTHQLRMTVGRMIADIQLILETTTSNEMCNTVVFIPL
jgi:predicted nuclease of predicted toxin-antitoxin system